MGLLAAGIILLALLMASYSERRSWLALGSTTISIILVFAFVFLSVGQVPSPVRQGLTRLAQELPPGWDRYGRDLATAAEQASAAFASAKKRAAERKPFLAASITDWFSWKDWFEAEPKAEAEAEPEQAEDSPSPATIGNSSDTPIKWFLDERPPAGSETFLLSGANVSDQPLKVVQAVLKPDSGAGKLKLTLDVEGHDGADGMVVPPGARFSLKASELTASEAEQLGGAILSVAYVQAGRRKTSIMYLTQDTLTAAD